MAKLALYRLVKSRIYILPQSTRFDTLLYYTIYSEYSTLTDYSQEVRKRSIHIKICSVIHI
ncbi:hypothetical protein V1478_012168, partial [Vespula squamosa]